MAFNPKKIKIIGDKIYYDGVMVAKINEMDMSRQRFEFQDWLNRKSKEGEE